MAVVECCGVKTEVLLPVFQFVSSPYYVISFEHSVQVHAFVRVDVAALCNDDVHLVFLG
jgi:hypothetical protein